MLTTRAVRIFDICIASVLGLFVIFCFVGVALAVSWASQPRPAKILRRFNGLWKERVALELFGGVWLAWQLLRMLALWGIRKQSVERVASIGKTLCRVYLGVGLGFLQPMFLLTALLLAQHSLGRQKPKRSKDQPGCCAWSVVPAALAATLPLCALQLLVAFFSQIFSSHHWEERAGTLPHYFFAVWYHGSADQCSVGIPGCIICLFPAASVILSLGFTVVFLLALWVVTVRLAATVINRRLRLRIQMFRYGVDGLVVANLAVMGASVSTNPFNIVWQLLWVAYALTAAAAVGLVTALLVVLPVLDARTAAKVSHSDKWNDAEEGNGGPAEPPVPPRKGQQADLVQRSPDGSDGSCRRLEADDSRRALNAGMRTSSAKTEASAQAAESDDDLLPNA